MQEAPDGTLSSFVRERFEHAGHAHDIYRKGQGPAVVVMAELPGITPQLLGFADRIAALGCSVVLPDLFGEAGRDPRASGPLGMRLYAMKTLLQLCISREFSLLASGRSSPVVDWLRGLAAREHERCGGPGVGVVGMCLTGGFALAMAVEPSVIAPVVAQPSLPLLVKKANKQRVDCSDADLATIAARCEKEQLRVLGLRFKADPLVPRQRFELLRERLGDGFVAIELPQSAGHPDGPLPHHHAMLTFDLIDEPGQPTRAALDQVLALFRTKLLGAASAP